MADKPTEKANWVSDDGATKIKEPSVSKKLTGFVKIEKPPFNFLNWLFNILSHWINYLSGGTKYNIIIDSANADEADFATMAAYIASGPTIGDRVLVKTDEVLVATMLIPASIEITIKDSQKFTVATNFSPIIETIGRVKINGILEIENSDTGTIAKAFSVNGSNSQCDYILVNNISTGIITNAFYIESSRTGNDIYGVITNSGGGSITNDLIDNSGNDRNTVMIKGVTKLSRSNGLEKFNHLIQTKGSDIASAATLPLIKDGNYNDVTGSTTITAFAAVGVGSFRTLHFDAALTLTHHATNLILPNGENIVTQAGDEFTFVEYASGDFRLTGSNRGTKGIVQIERNETRAVATGTTQIPHDATKPRQSGPAEGDEYLTQAITPKNALNELEIEVSFQLSHSANNGWLVAALFQDAIAESLACGTEHLTPLAGGRIVTFTHVMPAGTTSEIIFKVRCGHDGVGTLTINGKTGAILYGGALVCWIKITERKP